MAGDTSGVRDSVVNQILAKLDGVNELGNILVVGLTNRKDLIDDAMLRPGRLELHIHIGLPDERGRGDIVSLCDAQVNVCSKKMHPHVCRLLVLASDPHPRFARGRLPLAGCSGIPTETRRGT